MSVFFDVQGIQSPAHGERGIARYLLEQALALERRRPDLVARFLLDPVFPIPATVEPLAATGKLELSNRVDASQARIYHVASPFEFVPFDRLWPPQTRRLRLVVTLYDLIPKLFPHLYLRDLGSPAWYLPRLDLIRRAERVLAISETTRNDAIEQLGVEPDRVVVVGSGVSPQFQPPPSRDGTLRELKAAHPWLEGGYVLYTGGIEPRKNIDRLLEAYARLPRELRARHQLVIVCKVRAEDRKVLDSRLRDLGIYGRARFTGFVPDEDLVRFYGAAELFVFPSLYEGFGLPVAEAMACGTPVIAARSSSLLELVPDEDAQFDPTDVAAIEAALRRALEDPTLRERLRTRRLDERHTWDSVADRTAAAYDELLELPRRRRRRTRTIAFVSPLPPQRSGVADYSFRLLTELARLCRVDAFADLDPEMMRVPPGVEPAHIRSLRIAEGARGGYDAVVYALGNSEFHAAQLPFLRLRPGIVLAHDVRLSGLYSWASGHRPDAEPRPFYEALHEMYDGRLPRDVGRSGAVSPDDANRYGIYMAREAIEASQRFLVHSQYAAQLARLEAPPGHEHKVEAVPFGFPAPEEYPAVAPPERPIVGTFGLVAPVKQIEKIVDAFGHLAREDARPLLKIVGPPAAPGELERYRRQAERLGIGDRVEVTGELDDSAFKAAVAGATVAVQLRASSNGESPASVADCLAAGVPTIVTALGAARELPAAAVVKVEADVPAAALATEIAALLADASRRREMAGAGVAYARGRSFARIAAHLAELLVDERRLAVAV